MIDDQQAEIDRLRDELERERMRLAACGVLAVSNTRESAKRERDMHSDYWSASAGDVANAVDREMRLREHLKLAVEAMEPLLPAALELASSYQGWAEMHYDIARQFPNTEDSEQAASCSLEARKHLFAAINARNALAAIKGDA